MQEQRTTKRILILGAPGTGKTTVLHRILQQSGQRALVITPYDTEWCERDANGEELFPLNMLEKQSDAFFSGIQRHVFTPKYSEERIRWMRRSCLVFDDCRAYITPRIEGPIRAMLMGSRQYMNDMIFVAHCANDVPPSIPPFITDLIMFRTEDNLTRKALGFKNLQLLIRKQQEINRLSVTNPFVYQWIKL